MTKTKKEIKGVKGYITLSKKHLSKIIMGYNTFDVIWGVFSNFENANKTLSSGDVVMKVLITPIKKVANKKVSKE